MTMMHERTDYHPACSGMSRSMRLVDVDSPAPSVRTSLSPAFSAVKIVGNVRQQSDQILRPPRRPRPLGECKCPKFDRETSAGWESCRDKSADIVGELPVEADGRHDHQPGNDSAGEENAGDARADDVAHAEIFGSDGRRGKMRLQTTLGGLRVGRSRRRTVHQEGVDAAEAESPEDAASKRAAAFTGDENVGASCAFGKAESCRVL